jgi:imidazoleglycerol-phosphate dehydratase/histidinol-phosphatase
MRKVLFVDRGGTLLELAPAGGNAQHLLAAEQVKLVPGVIPALLKIRSAGYDIVVVTNQPGLGAKDYPRDAYDKVDAFVTALFASQGVEFAASFACPHLPKDGCACRKPGIGLVRDFVNEAPLDRERSAMVGDSDSDLEFARNLGIQGLKLGAPGAETWAAIAHALVDRPRIATVQRRTRETDIRVTVDLDSEAEPRAKTGLGFFDHMLEQLGKHGGFALDVQCSGDLHIDEHHTVEDVALALGQALRQALGDKRGIRRYGFLLPMDEADAEVSIDLGGRPFLVFDAKFPRDRVGELPTELVPHFFRSLAETLGAAIHVRVRGENAHHMVEVGFKGVARALRQAVARSGEALPTTKGRL